MDMFVNMFLYRDIIKKNLVVLIYIMNMFMEFGLESNKYGYYG